MKFNKKLLLGVVLFSLFIFFPKPIEARIDSGVPCTNQADCDREAPGTKCIDRSCQLLSSLDKFQESLKNCSETGTTSLECWIGGTEMVAEKPENAATGVMPAIVNSLNTMILGPTFIATESGTSYKPGGAIGGITNLIAAMYAKPPASSVEYFADLGRNLGIVKPAYAQGGIGFQGLTSLLPLWKAFRNIAYLFFTIIFVVIGFAIMFRIKLDPQTVISIQNAIPRVVVALILVTFSYAIVGLLIDLVYILISLGVLVIAPTGGLDIAAEQQKYMGLSFGEGVGLLIGGGAQAIWKIPAALTVGVISVIIGVIVGTIEAGGAGVVLGGLGGVGLIVLILAVVALWVILKLFFSLLKCYLSIILSVIFAPLQIMLGVFPGAQMGFGSWVRNLLANIMVYPAVALFMLLGWILTNKTGPTWTPPVISVGGDALLAIIGYGMLLMVHKIPDIVKDAFKVKAFGYGTAIGEAIKGPLKLPYQTIVTLGTLRSSIDTLSGRKKTPEPPSEATTPETK